MAEEGAGGCGGVEDGGEEVDGVVGVGWWGFVDDGGLGLGAVEVVGEAGHRPVFLFEQAVEGWFAASAAGLLGGALSGEGFVL